MRITGVALGLLVLTAAIALVTTNELNTHSDLSSTRHNLAGTKRRLSGVEHRLTVAQRQLKSDNQQLQQANQNISNLQGANINQSALLAEAHDCAHDMIIVSNDINQELTDVLNGNFAAAQQDQADGMAEGNSADYTSNCGALGITYG